MKHIHLNYLLVVFYFLFGSNYANENISPKFVYLYPIPNSTDVRPSSSIIVKVASNLSHELKNCVIQINGSKSGSFHFKKKIIKNTLLVTTSKHFELGEEINVKIQLDNLENNSAADYNFLTSKNESFNEKVLNLIREDPQFQSGISNTDLNNETDPIVINGVSVPSSFPKLIPSISNSNSPGKIFMSNYSGDVFYLMIYESDGTPYYYKKIPEYSIDFKLQNNGLLTRFSLAQSGFLIMNDQYEEIDLIQSQNDYFTDPHDFVITEDSTYLLIGIGSRIINMSEIVEGGQPNAIAVENVIQELDKDQNVIFEWRSLDPNNYDDVTAAVHANLTSKYFEPAHLNSVAIDYDNNLLISSRHRSECTKIDRITGEVIWRLGGITNQFEMINENKDISFQHTFYAVPGKPNHYTIFDNGNFSDQISRVVEYKIDPINFTAEKVWEYIHENNQYAFRAGNAQRLTNGNTIANFVLPGNSKVIEIDSTGSVVYEADIDPSLEIHRTFKFKWETKLKQPYLLTELFENKVRLIFNKFGDSDVLSYNVYGGSDPQNLTLLDNTTEPWWDTSTNNLTQDTKFYFAVTALNSLAEESNFSNLDSIFINNPGNGNSTGILGYSEFDDPSDPIWIDSKPPFQKALSFTTSDQLVNCGNDPTLQISGSELTIQANIFPGSFSEEPSQNVIISKEREGNGTEYGYSIRSGGNGVVEFIIGDSSWKKLSTTEDVVKLNKWNHVTATFDGEFQYIYVDGILQAKSNSLETQIADANNSNFTIGNSSYLSQNAYDGYIDEVRIWNKALTQNQISALQNIELGAEYYSNPESGLVGYWQLNEGEGQLTVDLAKDNNIILNGDFSLGHNYWNLVSENSAIATGNVSDEGYYSINIENGGSGESALRLFQGNVLLVKDISYILEFDAWSTEPKFILASIRQSNSPFKDFSKIGAVYITETKNHFQYQFIMNDNTDNNAELAFMLGDNNIDLFIDNISLKIDNVTNIEHEPIIISDYHIKKNYPNPFNPSTTIEYILPKTSYVKITVFNILGEVVKTIVNTIQSAGNYNLTLDMTNFSSGIYFYSINAESTTEHDKFNKINKMVLLK